LSSEIITSVCRPCLIRGKAIPRASSWARRTRTRRESENLSMQRDSNRENREIPLVSDSAESERFANVSDGTANMYADGKSHGSVVPATTTNNGGNEAPAESDEGRDPAKRNAEQGTLHRTPRRIQSKSCGLAGVREVANDFALDLRQEPYEVILHVRVCAGGGPRGPSLPRFQFLIVPGGEAKLEQQKGSELFSPFPLVLREPRRHMPLVNEDAPLNAALWLDRSPRRRMGSLQHHRGVGRRDA
jgi:hypothetical protein